MGTTRLEEITATSTSVTKGKIGTTESSSILQVERDMGLTISSPGQACDGLSERVSVLEIMSPLTIGESTSTIGTICESTSTIGTIGESTGTIGESTGTIGESTSTIGESTNIPTHST